MGVRVVLYDKMYDHSAAQRVLGPYERVGVEPQAGRGAGCRLFDDHGREIARLVLGWQVINSAGIPYGRKWARMDVEAI